MIRTTAMAAAFLALAATLPAPQANAQETLGGAIGGAILGGAIGGAITGRAGGAAAGALIGGATGAMIGAHVVRHAVILHRPRAVAQPAGFALNDEMPQQISGLGEQRLARAAVPCARVRRVEGLQRRKRGLEPPPEAPEARGLFSDDLVFERRIRIVRRRIEHGQPMPCGG